LFKAFDELHTDPQVVRFAQEGFCYEMAVEYGRGGDMPLLMDCFYPMNHPGPMPAIVWIHGGGWSDHTLTRTYRPERELADIARMGFFVACIDYRLLDEAPFPAQIQDCKCAIRCLRAHADEWHIDPDHIGVWGESAGGHLAALLAVSEGVEAFEGEGGWAGYSSAVQCAVPWYAPCDLAERAREGRGARLAALVGLAPDDPALPEKLAWASPITYADGKLPPILMMHGDCDAIVPYDQSLSFVKKARAAGNDVRLVTLLGRGHGFIKGGQEYYNLIADFFGQHLQGARRSHVGGGRVVWEKPFDWASIGVDYLPDQVFATIGGVELKADWMLPKADAGKPRPVVVWFHGGGWQAEALDRKYRPEALLAELCRLGFVCVSADYRLLQQAPYPAPIEDAHCAIRYVRAQAQRFNLNPDRIGVWGESAGAATAQLLGVGQYMPHHHGNGGYPEYSSQVQAVCSWYGYSNYIKDAQLSGRDHNAFLNVDYDLDGPGAQILWRESPIAYASRPLPPFLLLHGSADPLVPLWQSVDFYNALRCGGNQVELYVAPGQVHGFFTDEPTKQKCIDFFCKQLMD